MQDNTIKNLAHMINVLGLEIDGFSMNNRVEETYHELSHSFKEEIIVPYIAISNNFNFFIHSGATKHIKTSDGVECIAEGYEEKHICDLEDDVKRIYDIDAWHFLKKWHKFDPLISNMMFIKIWLKKI